MRKNGTKRRSRILIHILALLTVAAVVTAAIPMGMAMNRWLSGRAVEIRAELIGRVEAITSQEVSWDAISPSVVRGITLYGVRLSDNASARRVDVRFNLATVLFGDTRDLIPQVVVDRPRIEVRTPEQRRRLRRTLDFAEENAQQRRDITVEIRNGSAVFADGADAASIRNVNGTVELLKETVHGSIAGRLSGTTILDDQPFALSTRISVELSGIRGRPRQTANVAFQEISGTHFRLTDQSFRIDRTAETIEVTRVESTEPLDVTAVIDLAERRATLRTESEGFVPADSVTLIGPTAEYAPWTEARISTDNTVRFSFDDGLIGSQGFISAQSEHPDLPDPLRVAAIYSLDADEVVFDELIARGRMGTARFVGRYRFGSLAPNGRITFSNFVYGPSPAIRGTATVSGGQRRAGLSSENLSVGGEPLYRLAASFERGDVYSNLSASVSLEEDAGGMILLESRFASLEDARLELRLNDIPTARAAAVASASYRPVDVPEFVSSTRLSGLIRIDRRAGSTRAIVPFLAVRDEQSAERVATVSGEFEDGTILIEQLFLASGGARVVGDGFIRIASGGTVDFRTEFDVNGIEYLLRGTYTELTGLVAFGPGGFEIRVARTESGGITINGGVRELTLPVGAATLDARFDGLIIDEHEWYLNVRRVTLDRIPVTLGGTASAQLAIAVRPGVAEIAVSRFQDETSTLAGAFEIAYGRSGTRDIQVTGRVGAFGSNERYRVAGRLTEDQLAVDMRIASSPVRRVLSDVRSGRVDGSIQIVGPPTQPQVRVFLESDTVRRNDQEFEFRILASADDESIRVNNSAVAIGATEFILSELRVRRASGEISASGEVLTAMDGPRFTIDVRGTTAEIDDIFQFSRRTIPVSAAVDVGISENGTQGVGSAFTGEYRFERFAGGVRFERNDGAVNARWEDTGSFDVSLTDPLPIQLQATGAIQRNELELTASGVYADLPAIAGLTADGGIEVLNGEVRGSLRLLGQPADPDIFGTLRVEELELNTASSPDSIGPFQSTLIFEEKSVRVPRAVVPIGNAVATVGGRALVSRFNLEAYEVVAELSGDPGVRVEDEFGPISLDGFVNGRFQVSGDAGETQIQGELTTVGTELALVEQDSGAVGREDGAVRVDVTVRTGRGVQFIWPDRDFPILRSNFATGQTVSITADTESGDFSLVGEIDIQSGDLFYFDRNFLLREGEIAFRESEQEFDPRLTARAELREVTPEGPVRIFLVAENQRLSEFSPRFESNPPLPGSEIIAILGGNIFQQGGTESVSLSTALLSTSDIVTQFGVFRQFEDAVRRQLDLDLFAIRTSVIQNVLLTALDPAGEAAQQVAPSLGTYLNDTSIFLGRYLGDSVFGQLVLQMRARDFSEAQPVDPGVQQLGGVLIDSEISLEWQTPFFLLEWNFAPQSPEELFIRDNTFSLSWSFSY